MKNKLLLILIVLFISISSSVFAKDEFIQYGPNEIEVFFSNEGFNQNKLVSNFGVQSISTPDGSRSYSSPDIFSSNAKTTWIWFKLRDNVSQLVKGIKVSRIEIIQNNNVLARTHDIQSYSTKGEYRGHNLEFINPFSNDGENFVDVVFYLGSKEVAKLKDFRIIVSGQPMIGRLNGSRLGLHNPKFNVSTTLINVDKDKIVDVYLTDRYGNKVTNLDGISSDYYDFEDFTRRMDLNLSFLDINSLHENQRYKYVITVDGKEIVNEETYLDAEIIQMPVINTTYHSGMPNLQLRVEGVNLLEHGPYKVTIEQNGRITKEINNVFATFNENDYSESIKMELHPEYFADYGNMYNVKITSINGVEISNFEYLTPVDDTSKIEEDIVDRFEGFKVFEKQEIIDTKKPWRIEFNNAIDENTINNQNAYVINKKTGISIKVSYSFEANGKILVMTPLNERFISGQTYLLIVENRIRSKDGYNLSKPAAMEFKVR